MKKDSPKWLSFFSLDEVIPVTGMTAILLFMTDYNHLFVRKTKGRASRLCLCLGWRRRLELNQTKAVLQTAALDTRPRRQFLAVLKRNLLSESPHPCRAADAETKK